MLRSNLCDYSDVYIVVKGRIRVTSTNNANRRNKQVTFKNTAPFISCISKINNTSINNAEDLDIFVPVHDLLEYNNNYSMTPGCLWNYYRDNFNSRINNNKTTTSKSFEYKTKLIGCTPNNDYRLDAEVVVPLKHLSNFLRSLDLSFINCEIKLGLSWSRYCVIDEISMISRTVANPTTQQITKTTTSATFQNNNAKLHVPVVTLSIMITSIFGKYNARI